MSDVARVVDWVVEWLAGGGDFLFLTDYDGTLTPIVDDPEQARLAPSVRGDLRALAAVPRVYVGVVSGRDLDDLRGRVAVPGLIYAGCHGLEIEGPGVTFRHPDAVAEQATFASISAELARRAATVPGMQVEHKRFGLAVHYRHVAPDQIRRVEIETARAMPQNGSRLKIFHGAKVIEIQPQVPWTKGDGVLWIRDTLRRASGRELMLLYMGDDWTDEHAFEALAGQAITIRVGNDTTASRAAYRLPDVAAIQELVAGLVARTGLGKRA